MIPFEEIGIYDSFLEKAIVQWLYLARRNSEACDPRFGHRQLSEIMMGIGREATPSNAASVSRSIRSLVEKRVLFPTPKINGRGNDFGLTERAWRVINRVSS